MDEYMVMGFKNLQRHLSENLFFLLLPAVIWLFLNASINRHFHLLPDGCIISHAHPYEKNPSGPIPFAKHDHTKTELFLLSLISDPASLLTILFFSGLFFSIFYRILKINSNHPEPAMEYYRVNNYHAPPFQ